MTDTPNLRTYVHVTHATDTHAYGHDERTGQRVRVTTDRGSLLYILRNLSRATPGHPVRLDATSFPIHATEKGQPQ
jgi:hypothetical protein